MSSYVPRMSRLVVEDDDDGLLGQFDSPSASHRTRSRSRMRSGQVRPREGTTSDLDHFLLVFDVF